MDIYYKDKIYTDVVFPRHDFLWNQFAYNKSYPIDPGHGFKDKEGVTGKFEIIDSKAVKKLS